MTPTPPELPVPVDDGGVHPIVPWLTERRRAYFYRLTGAALVAGFLLDVVTGVQVVAVAGVVAAALGTGMAMMHTRTKPAGTPTLGLDLSGSWTAQSPERKTPDDDHRHTTRP